MYRRWNATPAAEKVCRRTRVGNGIARAGDCSLPSASRTLWLKCDGSSQASRGKVAVDGGRDCEANGRSPATVAALSHRIEEPRHRKGQGTGLVSPGANSKGPSPPPRAPGERVARFATHLSLIAIKEPGVIGIKEPVSGGGNGHPGGVKNAGLCRRSQPSP